MATYGRLISSMPFQNSSKNVGRRRFHLAAIRAFCAMQHEDQTPRGRGW